MSSDDEPLTQTVQKKKAQVDSDDDKPLASSQQSRPKRAAAVSSRQQRRRDSSSSESDSSSDSSDDSSSSSSSGSDSDESDRPKKRKAPASKKNAPAKKKAPASAKPKASRKKKEESESEEESDDEGPAQRTVSKRDRTAKDELIAKVLARWWYALPDWPPANFDYTGALSAKKFRKVELDDWEDAADVDRDGMTKVYELSNFPGVFRDPSGKAYDMRPREGCPCYSEMAKKSERELWKLLAKAYENQLTDLRQSPYDEKALIADLEKELRAAKSKA